MFQGGAGRHQKNLASSYLRGIDNQLRGGAGSNSNAASNANNLNMAVNSSGDHPHHHQKQVSSNAAGHRPAGSLTNTGKRSTQGGASSNNKVVLAGIKMDGGSSRNKPMMVPSGTQKTRSFGNGKLLNGSLDLRKSQYWALIWSSIHSFYIRVWKCDSVTVTKGKIWNTLERWWTTDTTWMKITNHLLCKYTNKYLLANLNTKHKFQSCHFETLTRLHFSMSIWLIYWSLISPHRSFTHTLL